MISPLMIKWFERLLKKRIITPPFSVFEFGPQDITPGLYPNRAVDIYNAYGATSYCAADIADQRANCIKQDFNDIFDLPDHFDIVTDFGTFEHVFNVGHAFHSMHNITKPNVLILHVLPAFCNINHGFFNIHPMTYF